MSDFTSSSDADGNTVGNGAGTQNSPSVAELEARCAELEKENSAYRSKIRELTNTMNSILDSLPINILHKDLNGRIIYANRKFQDLNGLSYDQLIGQTDFDLFPAELAKKYQEEDQLTLDRDKDFETVEKFRLDDEDHYVLTTKSPLKNSEGHKIGIQILFWDITDLKETEKELHRSNTELNQFAYVASHDLQEPLRAIRSFGELIEMRYKDQLDEEGQRYLKFMIDGATRMKSLIEDLLSYSRIQNASAPFEPVQMQQIVQEAAEMQRLAIQESDAIIQTTGQLPEIRGDRGQLLQLVNNLIGNAVKYRREGISPVVTIGAELKSAAWEFSVTDNGIGISEDHRKVVFEVFRRLHGKDEYSGTGIGLAKCERVVQRHGGNIWVEAPPDGSQGTTIKFTIPCNAKPSLITQRIKLPPRKN